MTQRKAASIRARVRAEMTEEIKATARKHLAIDGANLSLRAVSRDLGMASSALYRYFASRDELLTALIIDAYNSIGEAAETADAAVADREAGIERWLAVARGLRAWALARPHEYALIYGSPVPGYAAPQDTVGPATRAVVVLGAILADAQAAGVLAEADSVLPDGLRSEIRQQIADVIAPRVGEATLARGMIAWTALFGAISFELFGQLNNVITERDAWFDHQVCAMAEFIGLRQPGSTA